MKTETQLRKALTDLGVYSSEEVEAQVATALQKGTVTPDTAAGPLADDEVGLLDEAALKWALEKASHEDDDDENDDDEDGAAGQGSLGLDDDEEEDDDGEIEAMQKALGEAIKAAVTTSLEPVEAELRKTRADLALVKARVEAVGDLAKALVTVSRDQLAKGGGQGNAQVLAKLADIERAITSPRSDFRGVSADQIEIVPAPGDRTLKKAAPDARTLQAALLDKQRAAYAAGDDTLASKIAAAIHTVDVTSTPEYRAEIAAKFSV